MDWSQYMDNEPNAPTNGQEVVNDEVVDISDEQMAEFIRKITGTNGNGYANAEISYQAYDYGTNTGDQRIFTLSKDVYIQISRNSLLNSFLNIDLVFKSAEDMELKLMWGRLQQHFKNESEEAEKNWIFYINVTERSSYETNTGAILTGNIFNPITAFLTRSTPNQTLKEEQVIQGALQGGNIIRMIVSTALFSFTMQNIDTEQIEADIQLENQIYEGNYE